VERELQKADRRRDAGYVLALATLLMVPLTIAVGFAVDVGYWYARAAEIQRAADAASLAGAVHLPDEGAAAAAAQDVLDRSGFTDSDGDGTVDGTDTRIVMGVVGEQQYRVRIVDREVSLFFSGLVMGDMEIRRQAVSEYILPVAMGSPRNFLGTGSDPADAIPASLHENFWLAASGPCASREQGEYLGTISDANFPSSGFVCTGGSTIDTTTSTYDPDGYFYAVKVPEGGAGSPLYIDIYDGAHCTGGTNPQGDSNSGGNHWTNVRLRGPDSNPYVPTDNPLLFSSPTGITDGFFSANGTQCANATGINSGGWRNGWRRAFTVGSAEAGIYFVQIESELSGTSMAQNGTNNFALRASYNSTWSNPGSVCSTDESETAYYDEDCPQVYGIEWMGVYANLLQGNLTLAEVGDEHSGKEMTLTLWDSGEGASTIEILDPELNSVPFDWEIVNLSGSDAAPTGGWSGSVTQAGGVPCSAGPAPACNGLNVSGTGTQPGPNRLSSSRYNDRLIQITIELPTDIETEYGGLEWWKVRYVTAGSPTDRTTWSVTIGGDPVRLVE
jgi:hypothetical protein